MSDKVEEVALNAYMDAVGANGEAKTDDDRRSYYRKRLVEVKMTYKSLILQKEEAEGYKADRREAMLNKLTPIFRDNYGERVRVVTELRKLGEVVDDPFVPLSKA